MLKKNTKYNEYRNFIVLVVGIELKRENVCPKSIILVK